MPLEIEIRFLIPTATVYDRLISDPLLSQLRMSDFKTSVMYAEYFDSPGHALQSMNATLRRRSENGLPRFSFKVKPSDTNARLIARQKWQCDAGDISAAVETLCEMGAPARLSELAHSDGFLALGSFEFERLGAPLMLPGGAAIEICFDKGVLLAGTKQEQVCELELKLLYGDPSDLEELASALEQKYELTRSLSGKYERLLRLLRSRR